MKTIKEIAQRLIFLLERKQFRQALEELFDENVESIDPINRDQPPIKKLSALIEREKLFLSNVTIDEIKISPALFASTYFTITLTMLFSVEGKETRLDEICVYQVRSGKIVSQQFFL
jgi:hypothetical protein